MGVNMANSVIIWVYTCMQIYSMGVTMANHMGAWVYACMHANIKIYTQWV